MNPTAEMADIVLPVTSPFESEGLKIGFEIDAEAQTLVQLRKPAGISFRLQVRQGFLRRGRAN
jgi:anaerobic selenocysteine-containing dehydrogenase